MAGDMRGTEKLQAVLIVSCIYHDLLLAVVRGHGNLAMDGSVE